MIVFRADANKKIGSGHVMRCLSLANAFRKSEKECCFVMAEDSFFEPVKQRGFAVEVLQTKFDSMEDELFQLNELLKMLCPEKVIVDSYYVTEKYLQVLKAKYSLTYIDDLAIFAYPVNQLVNYNAYGVDVDYQSLYRNAGILLPERYLGIEYAPLRDEFKKLERHIQPIRCQNVLISTGGADLIHLALRCVRYLQVNPKAYEEYCFHFVLGAMNPDISEIEMIAKQLRNVQLHKNVKNMEVLMQRCDLAVSAAGSTLYELCACGIPTITYILADNQIPGAEAFEKRKLMISMGDLRDVEDAPRKVFCKVHELAGDYERRKQQAALMQEMVDGCGAERLAKALLEIE